MMESQQTHSLTDKLVEWQPFATFMAELQQRQVKGQTEYRTIVSHRKVNSGAYWPGLESEQLHHWITSQMNQAIQKENKTMMQPEFEAENRYEPEADVSLTPDVEAESESEVVMRPESIAERQLESGAEEQSDVKIEPQSIPVAQAKAESEALVQSKLETEERPEIVSKSQAEPEEKIQPVISIEQPLDLEEKAQAEPKKEVAPTIIETTQIKAAQPPQSGMPIVLERAKPLLMKSIRRGSPFALEVSFKLSGSEVENLAKEHITYHSEFYVHNQSTGEDVSLGQTSPTTLIEGELTYTSRLPEAMLKNPGVYRLRVVTELDAGLASPDLFEVPFLKVV